jgi:2-isopropylmalate synthase
MNDIECVNDIQPFEPLRYELTNHSSPDGFSVSTATVAVRIGDLIRCETEDGTGAVDALERAMRQCLYAIYPSIADLEFAGYSVENAGISRSPAGPVRVTIEWNECGSRWSTSAVSCDVLQAVWMALTDGFRLQLARIIDRTRELKPEEVEMWAV